MKRYEGRRDADGKIEVWICEGPDEPSQRARRLANPDTLTAFNWGDLGRKTKVLADALCADALDGDAVRARAVAREFARLHLAPIRGNHWAFEHDVVLHYIEQIEHAHARAEVGA